MARPTIKLKKKGVRTFASEEDKKKILETEKKFKEKKKEVKTKTAPTIDLTKTRAPIKAEKEKGVIGKSLEAQKKIITSPKTTVALGVTLAILLTGGGSLAASGLGAAERAVITRTATTISTRPTTIVAQRAFVGKSGKAVTDKLFRFSASKKSLALTSSLLKKTFSVIRNPAFIITAIGSYPFANFVKEEAVQTLQIPIYQAIKAGDIETAERLIAEIDTMIAEQNNLLDLIPFANVYTKLQDFFKAAGKANEAWKEIIATTQESTEDKLEEPTFEEQRIAGEESARQRQLEERQRDAEYFNLIREGRFEEAEALLNQELNA